ncbi:putative ABC transporter ATP-binding protein YbhF [bacterium BMS3Bbin12]|nr:putative ABC transporter ATP-binding protein YbhF [bacterium BMS3Abin12]GBE47305.1 putative ABC transporter ATP-binding protein YbhF [bacterium BMS3Bbin12]GBE50696.1 putative ABC transporter ATP-binding protein YbhF [bacterium BMS3Bbin13]
MTGTPAPASGPIAGSDIVLTFRDVDKTFRTGGRTVQALRGVNLEVRSGQVTGLVGPDGAGKTTLMRTTAGLLVPDAGAVTVLGLDATHDSLAVQSALGYMPQRFGLYEDLTVQENLDLYARLQGVPKGERAARYEELTRMTGLEPFTTRLAGHLSGGMKQKLGLACTLIRPPRLLLLDEPTVGVDPLSRRELWSIVYRLVREQGMSVLLSTAYLDEAERCDEVILIHEGEVLGRGPPQRFTTPLAGRTYAVSVPESLKKRTVHERLADAPDVVDAVIQGEHIRLVMAAHITPDLQRLLPGVRGVSIEPIAPRFEDSFIATLRDGADAEGAGAVAAPAPADAPPDAGAEHDTVIEVRGLQRRFGDFYAVRNLTFEVRRGEVFGLLGANGAGKSTTFRMLCGLLPPSGGELRVAGADLRTAAADVRARIGYMSQKFSLYGNLSVRENLEFFAGAYGLGGRRRRERIAWALSGFDLAPVREAVSGELPLGFKQRLSLACALMHEPRILFLDEPTSGIDPVARRGFWRRINVLAERGVTVLVTTHSMEEAEYCDRLMLIAAGEILALGTPREIKARARTPGHTHPSMEDAFIALIEEHERERGAAA